MPTIATTLIRGIPPVFPPGFCWENEQQFANAMFEFAQWQFQSDIGNTFFNMGAGPVAAENRLFPWLNTTDGRWYLWLGGVWRSPYPVPAGPNGVRWDWEDSEANLETFDGGSAGIISTTAGAFWQIDHNYDGRSAMGAVPTLNNGVPFTVGTNYGSEEITQTGDQVGSHTHIIAATEEVLLFPGDHPAKGNSAGNSFSYTDPVPVAENQLQTDVDPMVVIHPVRAAYKIKRSIRAWYVIP